MSSKCAYFWNHVCVSSDRKLQPCCRFDMETISDHESNSTLENTDLSIERTLYQEYREQSLRGEVIPGCKKCYDQEKIGLKSLRLVVNEEYKDFEGERLSIKAGPIRNLELFLGNKCNLKCIMCNPSFSSKWIEDYKLMGFKVNDSSKDQGMFNYEDLLSSLPDLYELKLLGGEPFLYPNHLNLLKSIEKAHRKNIKIIYFTNATIKPNEELKELWSEFRCIEINMSIDGTGRLNDFLRFPSKWNEIEENVKSIITSSREEQNWIVNVHATVTNVSAFRLHELVKWFEIQKKLFSDSKLENLVMVPLVVPSILSLTNLTDSARSYLSKYFSNYKELNFLNNWLGNHELGSYDRELMAYVNSLEKIRGIRLKSILPEFEEYFQKIF